MNTRNHLGSMISGGCSSELTNAKLEDDLNTASRRCPSCGHELNCNRPYMVGLPAGVKFDPTDQELIQHLESMVKEGGARAHPLIDEFISTIQGEDGICYTHPENLPGVTKDGLSKHFFHMPSKAYTNGTRKRRKIQTEHGLEGSEDVGEARWNKTGKTRLVNVGGEPKGCKKILGLYTNSGKHGKSEKTNWVIHQYHLGSEEEKDGELVVSKVFYQTQPRHSTTSTVSAVAEQHTRKRNGDKIPEAMQDVLPGCAVTGVAETKQSQQQRSKKLSFSPSREMYHEEEKQPRQKDKVDRRSAGLEELIMACQ